MPSIGPLELGIILLIVLIVFGPKRLPGLGRQLGSGMREFKDSITGKDKDEDDESDAKPTVRQQAVDPAPAEPEVVSGETRPQDQPAPRADVS
jgi:sec-independent protein translocase protein TatA